MLDGIVSIGLILQDRLFHGRTALISRANGRVLRSGKGDTRQPLVGTESYYNSAVSLQDGLDGEDFSGRDDAALTNVSSK